MKKSSKIALAIIIPIFIIILAAFFTANHYLNKINKENLEDIVAPENETFETDENLETADGLVETDPDDVELEAIEPFMDDDLLNILLIGQDKRPGQGRQRSDSMVLCSINLDSKEISMISFMRDIYVQIPGDYSDNRLNAPYQFGGFPLLKETMLMNFGVTIDGCFEVDFDGFPEIIDILGGVDIELTAAEAKVIGNGAVEGKNHLDGKQALKYSRIRSIDSDFVRTERQRNVLTALFNEMKHSGISEILELADKVLPYMTTDLTNTQIIEILAKSYAALNSANIDTYRVPADDAYYGAMVRGMSVIIPDLPLIREELATYLPIK